MSINNDIAEPGVIPAGAAPVAADENAESIGEMIQSAVSDGFAALRKEMTPARRFINPADLAAFFVSVNFVRE